MTSSVRQPPESAEQSGTATGQVVATGLFTIEVVDCGKGAKPGRTCWRDSGAVYVARADGFAQIGQGHSSRRCSNV